jgi:hypothetical protein
MSKSNTKLTVVPPNEPQQVGLHQRRYSDFDAFTRTADALVDYYELIATALPSMTGRKVSRGYAEQVASRYSRAQLEAMVAKVEDGYAFYNRDELHEPGGNFKVKRRVVAEQVAILIGAFPNAGPHSPEAYTKLLIEEIVAATGYDAVMLEAACRKIRRTMKFVPTIAEMLDALTNQPELDVRSATYTAVIPLHDELLELIAKHAQPQG